MIQIPLNSIVVGPNRRELNHEAVKNLADSIKQLGLLNPIIVDPQYKLIAGLHRMEAFKTLGMVDIPAIIMSHSGLMARLAEIDENLIRNELHYIERGEQLKERKVIYEELWPQSTQPEKVKKNLKQFSDNEIISLSVITFTEDTALKVGLSQRTVQQEIQIAERLDAKVKAVVKAVDLPKTEALKMARLDAAEQKDVAARLKDGTASNVKQAKQQAKFEKREKEYEAAEILKESTDILNQKYHIIAVDPPWRYENRAEDSSHRAANPYPDMTVEEIKKIDIENISEANCVLWLWATNAFLHDAFHIADIWGFIVKTVLTWEKDKMGLGDWLRGKTEHCLMAVKGNPLVKLTNQTTIIHGPQREHSRKPDEFYEMVNSLCYGNKLDYFAREKRDGWDAYGFETNKF